MKLQSGVTSVALAFAALVTVGLLSTLYGGCDGTPCCPVIVDFKSQDQWVCPACPNGGTNLFFTFGFKKGDKQCMPDNPVGLMRIKNLTDGTVYVPPGQVVQTAVAITNPPGGLPIRVSGDCQIELRVSGDKGCDPAVKVIEIKAVDAGDFEKLCLTYNGKPFGNGGYWEITTSIFGSGVAVDHVVNSNGFPINVTHEGTTAGPLASGQGTDVFRNMKASGSWIVEVTDRGTFMELVKSQAPVCITVYLKCQC